MLNGSNISQRDLDQQGLDLLVQGYCLNISNDMSIIIRQPFQNLHFNSYLFLKFLPLLFVAAISVYYYPSLTLSLLPLSSSYTLFILLLFICCCYHCCRYYSFYIIVVVVSVYVSVLVVVVHNNGSERIIRYDAFCLQYW